MRQARTHILEYELVIGVIPTITVKCYVATNQGDTQKSVVALSRDSRRPYLQAYLTTLAHLKCGHVTTHLQKPLTTRTRLFQHGHTLYKVAFGSAGQDKLDTALPRHVGHSYKHFPPHIKCGNETNVRKPPRTRIFQHVHTLTRGPWPSRLYKINR